MFTVTTVNERGLQQIILRDKVYGTSATIWPQWGALLHSFNTINNEGQTVEVIDGYIDEADIRNGITNKGFKGCKLSPFVCRLKNGTFQFEGERYKVKKFILGHHALHGILYDAAFEIFETKADDLSATVILKHECKNDNNGWLFSYDCIVQHTLISGSELQIQTKVINTSSIAMPVQDGWHPYFTLGKNVDELQLSFNIKGMLEFDEELIPTGKIIDYNEFGAAKMIGETVFDNCFLADVQTGKPVCKLMNPETGIGIEITTDKNYSYLQVYTPAHRQSIALENISGAPDGFNNGMGTIILQPQQEVIFTASYKIVKTK